MSICLAKKCSQCLIGICLIFVELPSTSAESIHHEGTLTRKHDWEHENKKASNRYNAADTARTSEQRLFVIEWRCKLLYCLKARLN